MEPTRAHFFRASHDDQTRWAKLNDKHGQDEDHHINLSDYEMDLSEAGR